MSNCLPRSKQWEISVGYFIRINVGHFQLRIQPYNNCELGRSQLTIINVTLQMGKSQCNNSDSQTTEFYDIMATRKLHIDMTRRHSMNVSFQNEEYYEGKLIICSIMLKLCPVVLFQIVLPN